MNLIIVTGIIVFGLLWLRPLYFGIKLWYLKKHKDYNDKICIRCGQEVNVNSNFCDKCGIYIKSNLMPYIISRTLVIVLIVMMGFHIYNFGYASNVHMDEDGSPIVYVTPYGKKYHSNNCRYLNENNKIEISVNRAKEIDYVACSQCGARRIGK